MKMTDEGHARRPRQRSADNKWVYGGIIDPVRWDMDEPGMLRLRNGEIREVHPGDVVLVFRTGAPLVTFVGIEHRGSCAA